MVRLRQKHELTVVAVAGSVGKTSTKLAVAKLLEGAGKKVRYQEGNYNDRVSVPLVFFGLDMPPLYSIMAWFRIFGEMDSAIANEYPYDTVVVELGTDGPGQLKDFAYIRPDIALVTAVSPEHMEQFETLDAVALEELTVADFSSTLLVNVADVPAEYLEDETYVRYSASSTAEYQVVERTQSELGQQILHIQTPKGTLTIQTAYSGLQGASIVTAAVAVADILGVQSVDIERAASGLRPFSGRLQILNGVNNTTIIDDTYNSSPLATRAALDVLYAAKAPQKIAILGDMNELGDTSIGAHEELGRYCQPEQLEVVVTIGVKSRDYLAPAAKSVGCAVQSFLSAKEAGEYVRSIVKPDAIILAKGSQNGVFAEEAVKVLLRNPSDATKLVRQSVEWLAKK